MVSHSLCWEQYSNLSTAQEFCWQCPSCLFSVLPRLDICESPAASVDNTSVSDALSVFEMLSSPFSGFRLINHDVQGLCSKLDEIQYWLSQCGQTDVVFCGMETWMKPYSTLPIIPGFTTLLFSAC